MDVTTIALDQQKARELYRQYLADVAGTEAMRCSVCGEIKALGDMVSDNGRAQKNGWLAGECKECKRARQRISYDASRHRDHQLRCRYGIGAADYDAMLVAQNGACAVCEQPARKGRLHVDHDHTSGLVRGLLCARCNSAIDWSFTFGERGRAYLERAALATRVSVQ